jgi:hypothetical protein
MKKNTYNHVAGWELEVAWLRCLTASRAGAAAVHSDIGFPLEDSKGACRSLLD